MNSMLERLGAFAARRSWIIIVGWLIIVGGLLGARQAYGGEYVNNYTVSGTDSATGLDVLNSTFPSKAVTPARSCSTPRTVRSRRSKPP